MTLLELGFRDTFRERHPDLRAFTYFASAGGAGRLDQVWVRSAVGLQLTVANAAVVWNWPGRRDHDPSVADLLCLIPTGEDLRAASAAPAWRRLVAAMTDDDACAGLRQQVESSMLPAKEAVLSARRQLEASAVAQAALAPGPGSWRRAAPRWSYAATVISQRRPDAEA